MATVTHTPEHHSTSSSTLAVLALVASFVSAYTVDHVIRQLRVDAGTTFDFEPFILISGLLPLFVVAVILALAFLVLQRLPASRTVAVIYVVSGLVVAIVYTSFLVSYPLWLRATFLYRFQHALVTFGSQSSTYYLASAWILIGAAALKKTFTNPSRRPQSGAAEQLDGGEPASQVSVFARYSPWLARRLISRPSGVAGRPKGDEGLSNPIATTNREMLVHRLLIDMQNNRPREFQSLYPMNFRSCSSSSYLHPHVRDCDSDIGKSLRIPRSGLAPGPFRQA